MKSEMTFFISHASADLEIAKDIRSSFEGHQANAWLAAESIKAGANFAEEISHQIQISTALIVLLSPEAVSSPHVKREVTLAIDSRIQVFPVVIGKQADFMNTLPRDWQYWLSILQILEFSSGEKVANDIIESMQRGDKTPTNKTNQISRLPRVFVLALIGLVGMYFLNTTQSSSPNVDGATNDKEMSASPIATPSQVATDAPPVDDPTEFLINRISAFEDSSKLPSFPQSITDYRLVSNFRVDGYAEFRLFEGDDYLLPQYFVENGTTMSCQPKIWIMKWRSDNPDVELKVSGIDVPIGNEPIGEPTTGSAGYISGNSCIAPGFKFFRAINQNESNLVDVIYELQIWEYEPQL
jgi:hypothetical protein